MNHPRGGCRGSSDRRRCEKSNFSGEAETLTQHVGCNYFNSSFCLTSSSLSCSRVWRATRDEVAGIICFRLINSMTCDLSRTRTWKCKKELNSSIDPLTLSSFLSLRRTTGSIFNVKSRRVFPSSKVGWRLNMKAVSDCSKIVFLDELSIVLLSFNNYCHKLFEFMNWFSPNQNTFPSIELLRTHQE